MDLFTDQGHSGGMRSPKSVIREPSDEPGSQAFADRLASAFCEAASAAVDRALAQGVSVTGIDPDGRWAERAPNREPRDGADRKVEKAR